MFSESTKVDTRVSKNSNLNELVFDILPGNKEVVIFEWEGSLKEISFSMKNTYVVTDIKETKSKESKLKGRGIDSEVYQEKGKEVRLCDSNYGSELLGEKDKGKEKYKGNEVGLIKNNNQIKRTLLSSSLCHYELELENSIYMLFLNDSDYVLNLTLDIFKLTNVRIIYPVPYMKKDTKDSSSNIVSLNTTAYLDFRIEPLNYSYIIFQKDDKEGEYDVKFDFSVKTCVK